MTTHTEQATPDVSTPGRRIGELDVLRGFALCGILVVNVIAQLVFFRGPGGGGAGGEYPPLVGLVFVERFLSIFALLFGVGFGLFLRRARLRTDRPRVVLARRLAVLLVIGVVHQLFHFGEALLPYALFGLVLLIPMSFLGPRGALAVALVVLFVGPQVESAYGLIPGLLALGFALALLDVPAGLARHPGRVAAVGGLCLLGTAAWWYLALARVPVPRVTVIGGGLGGTASLLPPLAATVAAVAYCCVVLLLLRTPLGPALDAVLAPMGRMALTNYLAATVLFLTLGPLLGIDSLDDGPAIAGLTVGILVVQAVWSRWWLRSFRYGPAEWLWRCLTWWQRAPLRR